MRYVDDSFVIVESRDNFEEILYMLNKLHKNIKFTAEFEDKNNISFLDVRLKRESEGLITDVYRKQTFSSTYLLWNILTTSQYKINLIKCLFDRSWKICSYFKIFHQEIQRIKLILQWNLSKVGAKTSPLQRPDYSTVQIIRSQLNEWPQFLLPIFRPFYSCLKH